MWKLIRLLAIVVVAVVLTLASGQGDWLLTLVDRSAELVGLDPPPRGSVPSTRRVVLAGMVAGVAAASLPPVGHAIGQLVTLLHELGHTLLAAALGARPAGIVLRHDASGHATARWFGAPGPVRRVTLALTAFVGLPAPAVAAASGAALLVTAGPRAVLWSLVAAGAVVAVLARSLWSLLVAGGLAGLAVAALADAAEPWAAGVVVALLVALACRSATGAARRLPRPIPAGDDARAVRTHLALPPRFVQLIQVVVTVAAGVWTVWQLVAAVGW